MIEESGYITVVHRVNAEEVSHWFWRAGIGCIIRIIAKEVQVKEVCYSLQNLEMRMVKYKPFDHILLHVALPLLR